jgi:hypothetical protein
MKATASASDCCQVYPQVKVADALVELTVDHETALALLPVTEGNS